MRFRDRRDAGRRLAAELKGVAGADTVVLGLPRGGIPVAYEVALALGAPLDVMVVRKVGAPFQPELGLGAVGEDGTVLLNRQLLGQSGLSEDELQPIIAAERREAARRVEAYRAGAPLIPLADKVAIIVDDGLATGFTARAAAEMARHFEARRVIVAVPVGAPATVAALGEVADEVVCLSTPRWFMAVGEAYEDFSQTSDEEVRALLQPSTEEVTVDADGVQLAGTLCVPPGAGGLIIFAHGSGSSRHSPRNQVVATALHQTGLATLLFDLLTVGEERDRGNVFDIELLGSRLTGVTRWTMTRPSLQELPFGYFGASTGAAAALWAAADLQPAAVVSRGGRPDLAGPLLPQVTAPTLLIVGERDDVVLDLNRQAQQQLGGRSELAIVAGATHLFEERGALEEVSDLAAGWFSTHLRA